LREECRIAHGFHSATSEQRLTQPTPRTPPRPGPSRPSSGRYWCGRRT